MRRPSGAAFLLSRLGTHVAAGFAQRLAPLGVTPAQVAVLREVGQAPGLSQQELSRRLGSAPSRVVVLVDELEAKGLLERRRSDTDRRTYELHVAEAGVQAVAEIRAVVSRHDADLVEPLTAEERAVLVELLGRIAVAQGLPPRP